MTGPPTDVHPAGGSSAARRVRTHLEVPGVAGLDPTAGRLLITVGVFDGLHRGHTYLLGHLRREARRIGARPAVVTFDAHPDELLVGAAPPLLCDPAERLVRLAAAGIDVTIVQHFDAALRRTTYQEFVAAIRRGTTLAGFVMTPDAAFGHERRGTPTALAALGREWGFEVLVVPPLDLDGRPVRSTEIRRAIEQGDLGEARRLLGRRLAVVGDREGHSPAREGPGRPGRSAMLTFRLPAALPPAGTYPVEVERAWELGVPRGGVLRARAFLDASGMRLESTRGLPESPRLRVTFR